MLYSRDLDIIYKPVQEPPKGPHEVAFYQRIFAPDCVDPVLLELRSFLPMYKGVYRDPWDQTLYLGLSDLLSGLHHPVICDIKVGRQTYTPDAPEKKRATELAKYKWQDQLGFCISGMQIVDPHSEHRLVHLNRGFGRSLDPSTVYDHGIKLFLGVDAARACRLADNFVRRLTQLANWFERQHEMSFYSTSILLAYDGVPQQKNGLIALHNTTKDFHSTTTSGPVIDFDSVVAHMVDFTRLRSLDGNKTTDENFLYGLRNLISLFSRAAAEA
ncbi:Kinase [Paragonimus heterotremus]|uniref:Kinase n=1 Tax=Paragonimus heterotremus TaxID=100268 RepID=A0A8J4SM81_9TREM|nr:Kinase [Paragonimus heterotremus]